MAAAVQALLETLRPGGRFAITTWGPRFFEPANTAFWNAVREVRPELYKGFNPWDRLSDPSSVRRLLSEVGVKHSEVVVETGQHPIPSPEAWWTAVLGSGYRGTLDQLDEEAREYVRKANFNYIRESGIRSVEASVIYAVGAKD